MADRARWVLLVLALLAGIWLRVGGIADAALFGDEYHNHGVAEAELGTLLTTFDRVGSHVVAPVVQHVSLALLGKGPFSFRLVALLPGLATLLLLYPFAVQLLGTDRRTTAVCATVLLAVNPMHVYYSRFGRAYAAIVLLGLLLAWLVVRATRAEPGSRTARTSWVGVAIVAALLPVTHLSSAGTTAFLGLAAILLSLRRGGTRAALAPAGAFAAAAVLALLAFLPVLEQVRAYFAQTAEVKDQPLTWFGIPLLLAGGTVEGALLLAGLPLATFALWRERTDAALLLLCALLGPLVTLLALRPHGMEYAWSRYLLGALPFAALALGYGLERLLRGELATQAVAAVAAALTLLAGPLADRPAEPSATANSYLALRSLPAFDRPWPDASPFYAELAAAPERLRIVESPPPLTRASLLFRNLALRHGKELRLGWPGALPGAMGEAGADGPYVDLLSVTAADADFVVLHRELPREVDAYWAFVYDTVLAEESNALDAGFMERHRSTFIHTQPHVQPKVVADLAARLRERLGAVHYKDERILVWKLSGE